MIDRKGLSVEERKELGEGREQGIRGLGKIIINILLGLSLLSCAPFQKINNNLNPEYERKINQYKMYRQVEDCMGLQAIPPTVKYDNVIPCPTSRKMCCLESYGYKLDGENFKGAAGLHRNGTIILPDPNQKADYCGDAFKHEVIHYLLRYHRLNPNHDNREIWKCSRPQRN